MKKITPRRRRLSAKSGWMKRQAVGRLTDVLKKAGSAR